MASLYLTRIQPNPPGRDRTRYSAPTNQQLNEEMVEFVATTERDLTGDELWHLTFSSQGCTNTGTDRLAKFESVKLSRGDRVMVHTGSGQNGWNGSTYHVYLGRRNYAWNNDCGDRASLAYNGTTIDWAQYDPNPREGLLKRIDNTNKFA